MWHTHTHTYELLTYTHLFLGVQLDNVLFLKSKWVYVNKSYIYTHIYIYSFFLHIITLDWANYGNLDNRVWPILVPSWNEGWQHPNSNADSLHWFIGSFQSFLSHSETEMAEEKKKFTGGFASNIYIAQAVNRGLCNWFWVQDFQPLYMRVLSITGLWLVGIGVKKGLFLIMYFIILCQINGNCSCEFEFALARINYSLKNLLSFLYVSCGKL